MIRIPWLTWRSVLFGAALLLAVLVGLLTYGNLQSYRENERSVRHTQEVLTTIEGLLARLNSAETNQRGYLLTGSEELSGSYRRDVEGVWESLAQLRQITADNRGQQERLGELGPAIRKRIDLLERASQARRSGGFASGLTVVMEGRGVAAMRDVRSLLSEMGAEERRLRSERSRRADGEARNAAVAVIAGTTALLGFIAFAMFVIEKDAFRRSQAETALRISEERYRLLVEGARDYSIVATDADGVVMTWNSGVERVGGYRPDEIIGKPLALFYTPEDRSAGVPERILRLASEAGGYRWAGWQARKDGIVFWAEVWITALQDQNGTIRGFSSVTHDRTEHRRSEEALRESAATVTALLETAAQSIVTADREGRIQLANATASSMFGYAREEFSSLHIDTLLPERLRGHHSAMRDAFFASPQPRPMGTGRDLAARRKDGSEFPVEISLSTVDTRAGRHVVAFISDITSRKHAERKLLELNQTLEDRVAERTAQLASANKELEAFAYSVSHDLRAPLRAVDGYSRVLLEDYAGKVLDDEAERLIARMRAGVARMGQLIEDLLGLSRVSRVEMRPEDIDLSAIAETIIAEFRRAEPDRPVHVDIQPGIVARGDARLLGIVLDNLLGNAWKFTSKTPAASVEFASVFRDSRSVYSVKDNGAGFNMAYAGELFGPFQRLHKATEFPGTGIGLATVQRIVHRHGGEIWAEAQKGKGATFYFTLG